MRQNFKEIKPGVGIADIRFGMRRDDVHNTLGPADEVDAFSYEEAGNDKTETWMYETLGLSLGFDEEEQWRLISLTVNANFYQYKGTVLIGKSLEEVKAILNNLEHNNFVVESWDEGEESTQVYIEVKTLNMNIWFEDGICDEVEWGPLFIDDDTIKWPDKA